MAVIILITIYKRRYISKRCQVRKKLQQIYLTRIKFPFASFTTA